MTAWKGLVSLLVIVFLSLAMGCASHTATRGEGAQASAQTSAQTSSTPHVVPSFDVRLGYFDDFHDPHRLENWLALSGAWSIGGGMLSQQDRGLSVEPGQFHHLLLEESETLGDVDIRVDVRLTGPKTARERRTFWKRSNDGYAGVLLSFRDPHNFYCVQLARVTDYSDGFYLYKMKDGMRRYRIDEQVVRINPDQWFTVHVKVRGNLIQGYLNDELVFAVEDPDLEPGYVGLATRRAQADFADFEVRVPMADKPTQE